MAEQSAPAIDSLDLLRQIVAEAVGDEAAKDVTKTTVRVTKVTNIEYPVPRDEAVYFAPTEYIAYARKSQTGVPITLVDVHSGRVAKGVMLQVVGYVFERPEIANRMFRIFFNQ